MLDRLHQFLPQMEAANADLLQRAELHPESVDIEHLDASAPEGAYIEMVSAGCYLQQPTCRASVCTVQSIG